MDDVKLAEINQHALMEIFPEADRACKDVSRMYFGGKGLMYFDESIPAVDTELLLRNMTYHMKKRRGPTHYKSHIRKFANKHGIALNPKGHLDIAPIENPHESPENLDNSPVETRPEKASVSDECENGKISPKPFIIYRDIINENGEFLPNSRNNKKEYYQLNLHQGHPDNSGRKQAATGRNHKDSGLMT